MDGMEEGGVEEGIEHHICRGQRKERRLASVEWNNHIK